MTKRIKTGFFSDLDQTLIYSLRAIEANHQNPNFNGFVVIETIKHEPAAFMTIPAVMSLAELSHKGYFVPVTTRTTEQYKRISFPNAESEYAITTNGAVILHNGEEDTSWFAKINAEIKDKNQPLKEVEEYWTKYVEGQVWVEKIGNAHGMFVYFIVDREQMPNSFVTDLEAKADEWNYTASVQGRKIYFVPTQLTKGYALQEVSERLELETTFSAGDANLDKSILEIVDRAWRPAHGGLEEENYTAANLTITKSKGIYAGEEILADVLKSMR